MANHESKAADSGSRSQSQSKSQFKSQSRPWSESDLQRLRDGLRSGVPILQLAASLMRDVDAVEAKIAELTAQHVGGESPAAQR
jgi:hypothetical protein